MIASDIVLVNFQGARTLKRRPALIVSTQVYHRTRPDVVLAILTTQIQGADTPTDYVLKDWKHAGLRQPSAFRAYFGTYEQHLFSGSVGRLSDRDWKEVQVRLRLAIAVDEQ